MTVQTNVVERALALFREVAHEDPRVARALAASSVEFFGTDPVAGNRDASLRHLEWFLFERDSDELGGRAAEVLLPAFCERADDALAAAGEAFLDSLPGVYEVTEVRAESGVWLCDLAGGGEYPLVEPEAASELSAGDLIVGRLYPVGEGCFRASPSAGCFRNKALRDALRRDFDDARAQRRGVPRVSQAVLEGTFFGPEAAPAGGAGTTPVDARAAVAHAVAWLTENGVDEARCEGIVAALRSEPFEAGVAVPGHGDVVATVLEELAFDTEVDLDRARVLLLETWGALWAGEAAPAPSRGEREAAPARRDDAGARSLRGALEELDRVRASGGDVDAMFDELERRLGLDQREGEDEERAPDFPGVVGAMIDEFLWDVSRESAEAARIDAGVLRKLAAFAEPVGVFEELSPDDLLAFAGCWLLEHGELADSAAARDALAALGAFCRWAEEQHHVALWTGFGETLDSLQGSLPRLVEANRPLARSSPGARVELGRVQAVDGTTVAAQVGDEPRELELPPASARHVRAGDWLRILGDGSVAGVYPPESSAVLFAAS